MNRKEILEKVSRAYDVKVPDVLPSLNFSEIEVVPMKKVSIKKKYITAGIIYAAACIAALILIPLIINSGNGLEKPEPPATDATEETYDLGGDEFVILSDFHTTAEVDDINSSDDEGYYISDAIKRRNDNTEKEFNIKLKGKTVGNVSAEVNVRRLCGQNDFDAVIGTGRNLSDSALEGNLYDLRQIKTMDFSKSYWLPNAADSLTISDKMFFTSSKITLSPITHANFLVFNGDVAESLGYKSPYDHFDAGSWNYDTFVEMMVGADADLDGSGEVNIFDRHAGLDPEETMQIMCYSDMYTKQEDNLYSIVLYTEKMAAIWSKYNSSMKRVDYAFSEDKVSSYHMDPYLTQQDMYQMFADDRALFINYTDLANETVLAELINSNCGIIPYPTYSKNDKYVTTMTNEADMLAIPFGIRDPEMTGRILEFMASESEKTVYGALYEKCSNETGAGKRSTEMLDLILDSARFDWTLLYVQEIREFSGRSMLLSGGGGFASVVKRHATKLQKEMDEVVERLSSLPKDSVGTNESDVIFGSKNKPIIMPFSGNMSEADYGRKSEMVYSYLYSLTSEDEIYVMPELKAVLEGDSNKLLALNFMAFSNDGKEIVDQTRLKKALLGDKHYTMPKFEMVKDSLGSWYGTDVYMTVAEFLELTQPEGMRVVANLTPFQTEGGSVDYILSKMGKNQTAIVYLCFDAHDAETDVNVPEDEWEAFEARIKAYYDDSYLEKCKDMRENGELSEKYVSVISKLRDSLKDYTLVPELCGIQMLVDKDGLKSITDNYKDVSIKFPILVD